MNNRVERLAARLPEDVDAALITSGVSRQYLTGMRSTAGTMLVFRDGSAEFIIDSRYIEKAKSVIKGCNVQLQTRLYEQLSTHLKRRGARRVAVESAYLSLGEYLRLKERLPEADVLMDGRLSAALERMRCIKSPEEVASIRAAQQITDACYSYILGEIRPGRTDWEIACEMIAFCYRNGAERPAFDFIVVSGAHSSMPHGVPTDKQIEPGDFVTMDFGCMVDGYCSDMTRTVAVGRVSEEQRRVYDIVLRAQRAAIAAARPGVNCRSVDAAARDIITAEGYGDCFGHGTGHSLGLEIHEDPRFSTGDETVCEPGMIITVEPGIYLEGRFGVRTEDMVLLTEDGCLDLTGSDKELTIL